MGLRKESRAAFKNAVEKVKAHSYPADERVSLNSVFYHQYIQNISREQWFGLWRDRTCKVEHTFTTDRPLVLLFVFLYDLWNGRTRISYKQNDAEKDKFPSVSKKRRKNSVSDEAIASSLAIFQNKSLTNCYFVFFNTKWSTLLNH